MTEFYYWKCGNPDCGFSFYNRAILGVPRPLSAECPACKRLTAIISKDPKTESVWIPFGGIFDKFKREGLNKPGTLIVVEGKQYLIGHINELGGYCDDCVDVYGGDTVEKYKVVWEGE